MYTITFANGTTWQHDEAIETGEFYDGAQRRTLSVRLIDPLSLDEVQNTLRDPQNTASVTLACYEDETLIAETIYERYEIKIEIAQRPVVVGVNEETGEEMKEERISFKLGRLTPIEIKLAALGL